MNIDYDIWIARGAWDDDLPICPECDEELDPDTDIIDGECRFCKYEFKERDYA